MTGNEKTTALIPSVGADGGQPLHDSTKQRIPHETCESNPPEENIEEMRERIRRMNDPRYLHTVSMTELYQTAYKSRPPVIDGLLYSGAYILAGAPKIGKSFLVAQLAYHVSTGQRLWGYEVHQGTVLYLALEDDFQRIQSRMFMMYGVTDTASLHFATAANKIGNGLDEQLENFIKEHPDTKLVIIDTMQKIREAGGEAYSYASDYEIIGRLKRFADRHMHADERNRAMSDALGQDVYHYHLHVVYIPIVEKQILWTKRCKDKSLVGTVKETIQQVSMSKKWDSKPALDEHGKPLLNANGKTVLRKSYSVLQDDFFAAMRKAGYDDVERGERGSSEEHLTVTQFKVQQEQARLESIEDTIDRRKQTLEKYNEKIREQKGAAASFHEIDSIGKKTISGNISMTPQAAQFLKELAKEGVASRGLIGDLKNKVETLKRDVSVWKRKYEKLQEQTKDFMAALKRAPRKVKEFIQFMLHTEPEKPEQSRSRDMPRRKKRDMEL